MDQRKVLEKIMELSAKQIKERPIGIDSLAMMLGIQEIYLKPLLESLECEGRIVIHVNVSKSRRLARSGTVEYRKV